MASSQSAYGAKSIGATAEIYLDERARRESVIIQNNHATQTLHLGNDSSVTTSNGLKLAAGASVTLETAGAIWAIGSGAATTSNYWENF